MTVSSGASKCVSSAVALALGLDCGCGVGKAGLAAQGSLYPQQEGHVGGDPSAPLHLYKTTPAEW